MNEEVSRDMTGEADGMNQGVDSTDGVMQVLQKVDHDAIQHGIAVG